MSLSQWLAGGKVLVNTETWFSHMFRTQGSDFSFPYHQSGRAVQKTKRYIRDKFVNFKHPKQIYPVSFVIERFMPVNGWDKKSLSELKKNEKSSK